jgi:hypothetical protein
VLGINAEPISAKTPENQPRCHVPLTPYWGCPLKHSLRNTFNEDDIQNKLEISTEGNPLSSCTKYSEKKVNGSVVECR